MICRLRFILFLLICLSANDELRAQNSLFDLEVKRIYPTSDVKGALDAISKDFHVVFSYSGNIVDQSRMVVFSNKEKTLKDLLNSVLGAQEVDFIEGGSRRILILPTQSIYFDLNGYVEDKFSGERIIGAIVRDLNTGNVVSTNIQGYFHLRIEGNKMDVEIDYLGYKTYRESLDVQSNVFKEFKLEFDNEIPVVTILDNESQHSPLTGGTVIQPKLMSEIPTLLGADNFFNQVKLNPGVLSPNEASGGFLVRGGSEDQNLILFEGVPMYEVSHLGGLSNIFINDAIKEIDFHKEGFPSRYGGRLSSVMSVELKDGNESEHKGSLHLGLLGMEGNFEGPLVEDKVTFNLSGRTSWIDLYANQLFNRFLDNDQTAINYRDANAKVSINFTPTSKLNLSYYNGQDAIGFTSVETETNETSFFNLTEQNNINWGNNLFSARFSQVMGSKFTGRIQLSFLDYEYQSRGTYSSLFFDGFDSQTQELDVWAYSGIRDMNFSAELDYFVRDWLKFKYGLGYVEHEYNPSIQQSRIINQESRDVFLRGDSTIQTNEKFGFIESTIHINNELSLFAGGRLNVYSVEEKDYVIPEPRLSLHYKFRDSDLLIFSYSQMSQFVHRLVNPGTGLPSDLWVPSTANIRPEEAIQFSATYFSEILSNYSFSIGAYAKSLDFLLDYENTSDLFFNVINGDDLPVFNSSSDWEDKVLSGSGESFGLELNLKSQYDKYHWELAYTLSKTNRQFDGTNENEPFPYKYDRRNNLSFLAGFNFTKNLTFSMLWTMSSGSNFTLAVEEFGTIPGLEPRNSTQRNNITMPNYNHLDIAMTYTKEIQDVEIETNFGVYNVYNRFNPFYVYIYNNPISEQEQLKGISLFPILPYLTIKFKF